MEVKVNQELQPEFVNLLRSCNLFYQYCYTMNAGDNKPRSITIGVECIAITPAEIEALEPWGHFIVCPGNEVTLELYTSLPDDISKCII